MSGLVGECLQGFSGDHHLGLGILQDVLHIGGRVMRVQGHINPAGFKNAQQGGEEVRRALQIQPHTHFGPDTLGAQGVRYLVSPGIQIDIVECRVPTDTGNCPRRRGHLALE